MKRALLTLLLLAAMPLAAAPDKWAEAYDRGVAAVNGKNYQAAASALQEAIAGNPTESTAARSRNVTMVYVPHFWLGIAKYHLGDPEGALREWRASEDQGAVQKTEYWPRLKEWVARAETQKKRDAEAAAAGAKKKADAAMGRALSAQVAALSAGADRLETYRSAQRKLQDALAQFNKSGTDIGAFERAEKTAVDARELFDAATQQAKSAPKPAPVKLQQPRLQQPKAQPVQQQQQPVPVTATQPPPPPPVAVESEALVSARLAVQQYRRELMEARSTTGLKDHVQRSLDRADALNKQLEGKPNDGVSRQIMEEVARGTVDLATKRAEARRPKDAAAKMAAKGVEEKPVDPRMLLQPAWRAFASGDLTRSEKMLTTLLGTSPVAEAYLLRGCARYSLALLARDGSALTAGAETDFRSALRMNRRVRLDAKTFSPKVVAFFEKVRSGT